MVDVVGPDVRSRMMAGIRGKDTKPELLIRKALHREGFRYRLHVKDLPGKPDIVLPRHHAIILIHGCFWHGHDCSLFKWPQTRPEFWQKKIARNVELDAQNFAELESDGWRILTVWECALKGPRREKAEVVTKKVSDWIQHGEHGQVIRGARSVT